MSFQPRPRIRLSPDLLPERYTAPWSSAVSKAIRHASTDRREQWYHVAAIDDTQDERVVILCKLLAQARAELGAGRIIARKNAEIGIDIIVEQATPPGRDIDTKDFTTAGDAALLHWIRRKRKISFHYSHDNESDALRDLREQLVRAEIEAESRGIL